MKNYFKFSKVFTFCIMAFFVFGLTGSVFVERAQATFSHADLVELFVGMNVIPEEKHIEAKVAASGVDSGCPIDVFVEQLITLEIIPSEKANVARAVISNLSSAGPMFKGLFVDLVSKDAVVLRDESSVEHGKFTIKFDLTSVEDTLYLSTDPNKSIRAFIEGGSYGAHVPSKDQQKVTLTSTARREGEMFVIEKGTTEMFTIENVFTPDENGTYTYELGYVDYTDEAAGNNLYYVEATPRSLYRTESLELHATVPEILPWQKAWIKYENRLNKMSQKMTKYQEKLLKKFLQRQKMMMKWL